MRPAHSVPEDAVIMNTMHPRAMLRFQVAILKFLGSLWRIMRRSRLVKGGFWVAYTYLKTTMFVTLSGSWAALEALLAALGALLAALGPFLAALGRSWTALGRSWPILAVLGPLLAAHRPLLGRS